MRGHPLSKMIFQTPGDSSRQMELNVPVRLPDGSRTGPLLMARVPDSSTSTSSGSHENGAAGLRRDRRRQQQRTGREDER